MDESWRGKERKRHSRCSQQATYENALLCCARHLVDTTNPGYHPMETKCSEDTKPKACCCLGIVTHRDHWGIFRSKSDSEMISCSAATKTKKMMHNLELWSPHHIFAFYTKKKDPKDLLINNLKQKTSIELRIMIQIKGIQLEEKARIVGKSLKFWIMKTNNAVTSS